jgi:proteic killer suppression protein
LIRSFRDSVTEDIFNGISSNKSRKIPDDIQNIAVRKMDQLNAAFDINDMRIPPGNHLEKLKGNLREYFSVRVNDKYRIIFQWNNGDAFNVSIIDYH